MDTISQSALLIMVRDIKKPAVYIQNKTFFINQYVEKLIGYKNEEINNIDGWFKLLFPENYQLVKDVYKKSVSSNFNESVEFSILIKNGKSKFVRFTGYNNGDEVIWFLSDITEIFESREESLVELRAKTDALKEVKILKTRQLSENIKLKKSNKELEDFAYIASHDLKEPLRKISAFSTQLKDKYSSNLDEKGIFYIDRLTNASSRMQKLIDDLLHYSRVSRIEIDELEEIDPIDLMNFIEFKLERLVNEKNAKIIKKNLIPVLGNESLIQSLFQNIINNGIKFHRENILPIIEVDSEYVKIRNQNFVHYFIKDNGIGIESKFLKRVFNIFERLNGKTEYEGTGIGLAIAKRVVEKHNGKIAVESEVGVGTIFHLYLPNIK